MSKVVCKVSRWRLLAGNAPRSDRAVEVDGSQIKTLIENNQCHTIQEIAEILKISKSSIENHFHHLGNVEWKRY